MDTSPFNTEDQPSKVHYPSWEEWKATLRSQPRFNAADELQKLHGNEDLAQVMARLKKTCRRNQQRWKQLIGSGVGT